MRFSCSLLLTVPLALAGCDDATRHHDLAGTMDASLTGTDGPMRLDDSIAKFRAYVSDDGKSCKFESLIETYGHDVEKLELAIQPTTKESEPLLSGQATTIAGHQNGVIVNGATVYLVRSDSSFWSKGGSISIDPLPAPKGKLRIRFEDVSMTKSGDATQHTLTGEVTVTYVGVIVHDRTGARACPSLAEVPPGLTY